MNVAESTVILTLDIETQRRLVAQVRAVMDASPLVQPVAIGGLPMSVRITSAGTYGWVADGSGYRYSEKDAKGYPWPRMPGEWIEIADRAVAADPRHDGSPCTWDSAIINWYGPKASLGWHADKSEADLSRPIVTISLGDAATWGVEVETRGVDEQGRATVAYERLRTRLESGGVTVLAGPLRSAKHTIEGIIAAPMFSPITKDGAYVPGRISITLRQAGNKRRALR